MSDLQKRKPMRLTGYDYSENAAYFLTVCVKDKKCILWESTVGANRVRPEYEFNPKLSEIGNVIDKVINNISVAYESVKIDKYVIMPNHIHMILIIQNVELNSGEHGRTRFAPTISRIIKQTKGLVTKQIGDSIWQKSFYDHIIRNEQEYQQIWQYIDTNPMKWEEDRYYGNT